MPIVLAALLAVSLAAALWLPGSAAPAPVLAFPVDPPRPPAAANPALAGLTADDVARGTWALLSDPAAPGLSDVQRAAVAPALRRGAATRAELEGLRGDREALRIAAAVAALP